MRFTFGPAAGIESFFKSHDPAKVDAIPPGRWQAVRVSDGVVLATHADPFVIQRFCVDKDGVELRRKPKKGREG